VTFAEIKIKIKIKTGNRPRQQTMMTHSEQLFAEALKYIPGGVNSPVRAFRAVGGHPFFVHKARGARVFDVDGNEYVDYVGTWGPAILGHAHPKIVAAVKSAAEQGTSFGIPNPLEVEMARFVCTRVASVQKVRMCNSGTEACMSAIRLARGFTQRDKIIKFEGCYHGHADSLLVKAGSGALTFGTPDSAGVPAAFTEHTIVLPYNDCEAVRAAFAAESPIGTVQEGQNSFDGSIGVRKILAGQIDAVDANLARGWSGGIVGTQPSNEFEVFRQVTEPIAECFLQLRVGFGSSSKDVVVQALGRAQAGFERNGPEPKLRDAVADQAISHCQRFVCAVNGLTERSHLRIADDAAQGLQVGVARTFLYRSDGMHVIASPLEEGLSRGVLTMKRHRENKR